MDQRPLGRTTLSVSALGFGCGAQGGLMTRGLPDEQRQAVARAIEGGVTYFDTAPLYGSGASETNLGRTLSELRAWDHVHVGTKVRLSREDLQSAPASIRRSVEGSLSRLGRERLDLIQLHNQIEGGLPDQQVTRQQVLGEIAETLRQLQAEGKVLHVGCTGMGATEALHQVIASGALETVQTYFNPVNPSAGFAGVSGSEQDFGGLIDAASGARMGVLAIRVFAAGALSEARHSYAGDAGFPMIPGYTQAHQLEQAVRLGDVCRRFHLESVFEFALRFVLSKPGVSTALVGFSSFDQLTQALAWTERGELPQEAVQAVVSLAAGG